MPSKFSHDTVLNLLRTPLFSNCGKKLDLPNLAPFEQIDKISAIKIGNSGDWDYFTQERSGDMTAHLMKKNQEERDRHWNEYVKQFRKIWDSELKAWVVTCKREASLDDTQLESIRWSLLNYIMRESFFEYNPPKFFRRIGLLYLAGLYPCGVKDFNNIDSESSIILVY